MKNTRRLLGALLFVLICVIVVLFTYFKKLDLVQAALVVVLTGWLLDIFGTYVVARSEANKRAANILKERRRIESVLDKVETQKSRHRPCVPRVRRNMHLC